SEKSAGRMLGAGRWTPRGGVGLASAGPPRENMTNTTPRTTSIAIPMRTNPKAVSVISRLLAQQVDRREHADPHDVDEVPVHADRFDRHVVARTELATQRSGQDDGEANG